MKILITGYKGFCGRHFVNRLQGSQIVGLDIKEGIDCIDYFKAANEKFDLVIHLAAIVGGRETIENHPLAIAKDLSIDAEMFNWAIRTNQKRIIYFSSAAAYPIRLQKKRYQLKETDINLDAIKLPDFTYGWVKLTGEMLASHTRKYGIKVYIVRPFSGYGEDQDLNYPFPSFIKRIKDGTTPFEIWGNGNQIRDFIHINDIVEATLKVVELDIQEPVNLGSSRPISFNELAHKMIKISGTKKPPKIVYKLDKPMGVMYRCSDNKRMLSFYRPKVTLEEGIRLALETKR